VPIWNNNLLKHVWVLKAMPSKQLWILLKHIWILKTMPCEQWWILFKHVWVLEAMPYEQCVSIQKSNCEVPHALKHHDYNQIIAIIKFLSPKMSFLRATTLQWTTTLNRHGSRWLSDIQMSNESSFLETTNFSSKFVFFIHLCVQNGIAHVFVLGRWHCHTL
jgi:hypothetical protein